MKNNNNIKAVIFDLDGTLIDSMSIWRQIDAEFLQKRGIPVPDDLFEDVEGGNSLREIAAYFKQKFYLSESVEEIMQEWTSMVEWYYRKKVKLKPHAKELLELLSMKKIKLGLGTSNSDYLAITVLKANGILEYFQVIQAGCQQIKGKPFPDIFLKVARKLEIKSENILVFEDTLVGVKAAQKAGMRVVAVYDDYSKAEWSQTKNMADYSIENFYQAWELAILD
jgi:HAD superfamily hydrolase (TIGR01509 family)